MSPGGGAGAAMSIEMFDEALHGAAVSTEYDDGSRTVLEVARWLGPLDAADRRLVSMLTGPAIDVGCGPGRIAAALTARGVDALGLDVAPGAVRLARDRGAQVVHGSVFGPVPREGAWREVLLVDTNIGIGGDPVRLLTRARALLAPGGSIHAELEDVRGRHGRRQARLRRDDGTVGTWFAWAHVRVDGIASLAAAAGLTVAQRWKEDGRCFVELCC